MPGFESDQLLSLIKEKAVLTNLPPTQKEDDKSFSSVDGGDSFAPPPRRFKSIRNSGVVKIGQLSHDRLLQHIKVHRQAAALDLAEMEGQSLQKKTEVSLDDVRRILRSLSS